MHDRRGRLRGRLDCGSGWMWVFGVCNLVGFGLGVLDEYCVAYDDPLWLGDRSFNFV